MVALPQNLIKLNFILFVELAIIITLCTVSALNFLFFNIYTFVGVPLLTFAYIESSSVS